MSQIDLYQLRRKHATIVCTSMTTRSKRSEKKSYYLITKSNIDETKNPDYDLSIPTNVWEENKAENSKTKTEPAAQDNDLESEDYARTSTEEGDDITSDELYHATAIDLTHHPRLKHYVKRKVLEAELPRLSPGMTE